MRDITGFSSYGKDIIWPYLTLALCQGGSFRALYDMQETTHSLNDVACIMPGHMHRPIESSDDYKTTIFILSQRVLKAIKFHVFSHDTIKFDVAPVCHLTPEQAQHMMAITDQLEIIANHTEAELPHRKEMLLSILAIGYEFLNLYRREQDQNWEKERNAQLLHQFCDLVVEHYRESREVQFYADRMHLSPKYFSKLITEATGGMSPANWIEQYVAAQAKLMLLSQPLTVKEVGYRLGFDETASFCRFFKRVTSLTPREFQNRNR